MKNNKEQEKTSLKNNYWLRSRMGVGFLSGKEKEKNDDERKEKRKSRKEVGLSSYCTFAKSATCVSAPRVQFISTPVLILLAW